MRSILSEAGDAPILYPKHLPTYIRVHITRRTLKDNKPSPEPSSKKNPIHLAPFKAFRNEAVAAAEKRYLENLTAATQWNIQEACRVSELSRPRLYALLKKHALSRPSKP
jgi:transcriptional regulator of acetoin/glycerol metabolism